VGTSIDGIDGLLLTIHHQSFCWRSWIRCRHDLPNLNAKFQIRWSMYQGPKPLIAEVYNYALCLHCAKLTPKKKKKYLYLRSMHGNEQRNQSPQVLYLLTIIIFWVVTSDKHCGTARSRDINIYLYK
jgi:hypothetical protein